MWIVILEVSQIVKDNSEVSCSLLGWQKDSSQTWKIVELRSSGWTNLHWFGWNVGVQFVQVMFEECTKLQAVVEEIFNKKEKVFSPTTSQKYEIIQKEIPHTT